MDRKINVISHIDCINELDKMHKKLASKENELNNYKIMLTEKEKDIENLQKYKIYYENIIKKINKYEIYDLNDLFNFLNKYYNHNCINNFNIENNEYKLKSHNFVNENKNASDISVLYSESGNNSGNSESDFNDNTVNNNIEKNIYICMKCKNDYKSEFKNVKANICNSCISKANDIINRLERLHDISDNQKDSVNDNPSNKNSENISDDIGETKQNENIYENISPTDILEKENFNTCIKSSTIILNNIKKDYYKFNNKLLPVELFKEKDEKEIGNIFERINNNTITKELSNADSIICFYTLFNKYKSTYDKISSKTFSKYIKHNNVNYCSNLYDINRFYEKVKRCYDFIGFFKDKEFNEKLIVDILYKSNISYTKLYKIRGKDYEELKEFFCNKMDILKNIPNDNIQIKEINLKKDMKDKKRILNYYGNKKYLIDTISNHINNIKIDKDSKIYDLFTGSMSIAQGLNKIFPKHNIVVNDNNEFLMNFYKVLKSNKKALLLKINELNTVDNISNYKDMLNKLNKNDIVILDPPYDSLNNNYTNYGTIFNKECQEELCGFVKKIVKKEAKVIVFNNNTRFIKDLYKGFNINIINSYSSLSYSNKTEIMLYN